MLQHVGDHAKQFTTEYGNVSPASIGAIQRGLLQIEEQGGAKFFGEPMLDLNDFLQTVPPILAPSAPSASASQGGSSARGGPTPMGVVNILAADKLLTAPRLYATFLLWMLSELFETLPEVGDLDKPKLVFFFDEAHLLFADAPKALVERIERVVRLVRSKGVGVYFVTQNPLDIPDSVLGQLGNRVQHALRAYSPRDQKAVQAAAETMRPNPGLDIPAAITELAVGEALISFLDDEGRPASAARETAEAAGGGLMDGLSDLLFGRTGPRGGQHDGLVQTAAKSAVRSVGSAVGRQIVRGVLGSLLGGTRRR